MPRFFEIWNLHLIKFDFSALLFLLLLLSIVQEWAEQGQDRKRDENNKNYMLQYAY